VLFEDRVHKFEYKLNDTDDQIVEYIREHKHDIVQMSIQYLASQLFTVPNTITRFCKKLDYDGYSHFKNNLKSELSSPLIKEDSLAYNIQKTLNIIDVERLHTVTRLLHHAKRILFFGVGDTVPFCEMMVKNLKITGKHSEFHMHRHDMIHELEYLQKDDVLFLISLTGETSQVLEIACLGHEKQIPIVSMTNFTRNPLQQIAEYNLYCYTPQKVIHGYNATDRTPLMIVLRKLSECFWNHG